MFVVSLNHVAFEAFLAFSIAVLAELIVYGPFHALPVSLPENVLSASEYYNPVIKADKSLGYLVW